MADESHVHLPGVLYWAEPSGFGGLLPEYPPDLIVMHKTDNPTSSARGEAQYAHNRPSTDPSISSSHFYVDGGEVIGSVPLNYRAWAAHRFGNDHGWHVESCGMTATFMTAADRRCVPLVRQLCDLGKIPVRHLSTAQIQAGERGIVGHHDLVVATGQGSHTDPGWTSAQWDQFIAAVKGDDGMAIYEQYDKDAGRYDNNRLEAFVAGWDTVKGTPTAPQGKGETVQPNVMLKEILALVQNLSTGGGGGGLGADEVRAIVREELDKTRWRADA